MPPRNTSDDPHPIRFLLALMALAFASVLFGRIVVWGLLAVLAAALIGQLLVLAARDVLWRRAHPTIPHPESGPPNPRSGHRWACCCDPCAGYWSSRAGKRAYRAWKAAPADARPEPNPEA